MARRLASILVLAAAAAAATAAPVEIDGPNWHAIVIRPVDLWVGDAAARDDSLDTVKAHKANYYLDVRGQSLLGGHLIFQGPAKDPLITAINAELAQAGFEPSMTQKYWLRIRGNDYMDAEQYAAFADFQARGYRDLIRAQGEPETLESRIRGRKVAGALLSLATFGAATHYGGAQVGGAVADNVAGDVYHMPLAAASSAVPVVLPSFDAAAYETISVRRIAYKGGMNGQILIALKKGWTEADENQALVKAVAIALGEGTTEESIAQSREEDFAHRKKVWSDCVAAGDCKTSSTATSGTSSGSDSVKDRP
jgi:hypothetical protein